MRAMRTMGGGPCPHYDCSNRNSFGYCITTVCINEHYQQEQWGLPSTTNKSESVVIKQQTNADRIRAMTDEELAKLFNSWIQDCDCNDVPCHKSCEENNEKGVSGCINHWLDWLKQEVKDER